MEVLWWLVPPVLVTVLAMLWVSWAGREGHGEIDREVAAQRLAKAMKRDLPRGATSTPMPSQTRPRDRSTGIAVRPSRAPRSDSERRSA